VNATISENVTNQTKSSGNYLTIYANETGQPISKYIYGQFIEHTGRCIYDGIWAQMIEDRKFLLPPGSKLKNENLKSPWQKIGSTTIKMNTENAYVGNHSPEITLDSDQPTGIYQGDLGLIHNKNYKGYIILEGNDIDKVEISLVWGEGKSGRQTTTIKNISSSWSKNDFSFTAGADTENAKLEIVGYGKGSLRVGTISLMPADNIKGMRADVINLLRELNGTVYRWPGGLFANGYDWKKGIGDRDKRAPELNYAYFEPQIESHDFGTDEYMVFLNEINSEPYIAVSALNESEASLAVKWLEYVNGETSTPMGKLRADNGHPAPYNVTFWGVGNENWALTSYVEEYIPTHNKIAKAMLEKDPSIKIIAVGGEATLTKNWSKKMLLNASENMHMISEHLYTGIINKTVAEHVANMIYFIKIRIDPHRGYREFQEVLFDKDIKIALDEWNYARTETIQVQDYGIGAPSYYLEDALGYAAGLHEMIRNSDLIYMANTHPVNVNGGIKTSKTTAAFETTGLVMKLYGNHFGDVPVKVSKAPGKLDVIAAWKNKNLTIAIENPENDTYEIPLDIKGASFNSGRLWRIKHSDPSAYNEPGKPPQVVIEEMTIDAPDNLTIAPYSVNIFELSSE
jgi:alpha-N-arabinofuranosidase